MVEDDVALARRGRRVATHLHQRADVAQLVEGDEPVDLRDLVAQLPAVAIDHAAGHQQLADVTVGLAARHVEDRLDGFFLGFVDEAAGIDDHRVGVAVVLDDLVTLARQLAEHDLRVDPVLRAAQADHADSRRTV